MQTHVEFVIMQFPSHDDDNDNDNDDDDDDELPSPIPMQYSAPCRTDV
jgi:hypothetical protein